MSFVQRRRFLWILFFAGLALAAVIAGATTLKPLAFDELARQSVAVARLRCLDSRSLWLSGEIWTDTRFALLELHKGALPAVVTVRTLGGRADNLYSRVDESPAFRPAEELYLFLWTKSGQPYRILGWSQGTFRIFRDPRDGLERITQDFASSAFDERTRQFRALGIRAMPLTAFQQKLRAALRANPSRPSDAP
jgi:hypothetical protein